MQRNYEIINMSCCFKALSLGVIYYTAIENQPSPTHTTCIYGGIRKPWKPWVHPYLQSQFNTTGFTLVFLFSLIVTPFAESEDLTLNILNIFTYWITPYRHNQFPLLTTTPHAGFLLNLIKPWHPKLESWALPTLCEPLPCPDLPSSSWYLRREEGK